MYEVRCIIIARLKWHEQKVTDGSWLSFVGTIVVRQSLRLCRVRHRITPFSLGDVAFEGSGAYVQGG